MNDEKIQNIDFSKILFISSGSQEKNIPLRSDCYYILHNVDARRYLEHVCKIIFLQVYTNSVPLDDKIEKINSYTFVLKNEFNTIYTCWATDLLPHEMDLDSARNEKNNKKALWVGTFWDSTGLYQNGTELDLFFNLCIYRKRFIF
jgi:hypothetical protein